MNSQEQNSIERFEDLTPESIKSLNREQLLDCLKYLFDTDDIIAQQQAQILIEDRAAELRMKTNVSGTIKALRAEKRQLQKEAVATRFALNNSLNLELSDTGLPRPTYNNFLTIFHEDPYYDCLHYNLITNRREIHRNSEIIAWQDADEIESKKYIESRYHLREDKTHDNALIVLFRERQYNPIMDMVESLEWDGVNRCEEFLVRWAKAEDTPYTREVSRLIFAGGINRLYRPGCKFDDVPVLVGTKQGEGKSSLIRWLAINDKYFTDQISDIDGPKSVEQLDGIWIAEMAEMFALTKGKEVEGIKAYITRQKDRYRVPFSKNPEDRPRRCIFIGTSNKSQFLKDKTGNRRFFPVTIHSDGYDLGKHENECREYVLQCWAEARTKFKAGSKEMQAFAKEELRDVYLNAQEDATEDDWRIGMIEEYLSQQPTGSFVYSKALKRVLNGNDDLPVELSSKETSELSTIMNRFPDWERVGSRRTPEGRQRGWVKKEDPNNDQPELPF